MDQGLSAIPIGRAHAWASLGALATLVATWLFVPRPDPAALPTRPGLEAVAVDVSASAMGPRPEWGRWVRGELARVAERAEASGRELFVVEYAVAPTVVYGPGPARSFLDRLQGHRGAVYQPGLLAGAASTSRGAAPDHGSELERALALVLGEVASRGRAAGRVCLLSDGGGTGPDPVGVLEQLAAVGTTLEWPEPPGALRADLGLARLHLPRRVASGARARVGLEWNLDRPASSASLEPRLEFRVRDVASGVVVQQGEQGCPAPVGGDSWTSELTLAELPPGLYELQVRGLLIDAGSGSRTSRDWMPFNDRAGGFFSVGGRPRVALVTLEPEPARAFARRHDGTLELLHVEPAELPGVLPFVDALFTVDYPTGDLPEVPVRDLLARGGGWLNASGWSSLLDHLAAKENSLHEFLPLVPEPDAGDERDVILLVDGSGSMVGEPFELVREAVRRLALGARPSDHVQLRFFTGVLGRVRFESYGATREERAARLAPLMEAEAPGGSTDVLFALQTLGKERLALAEEGRRPALALLLTDGHTNVEGDRPLDVRESLAMGDCDLRILAAGAFPDRRFLSSLLFPGEELVEAGDLGDLIGILSEEVNRDLVHEDPGAQLVFAAPETFPAGSLAEQLVRTPWEGQAAGTGSPGTGLPRYARTRVRGGARELGRSSAGNPVVALERAGGGTVVSLAAAPWGSFGAPDLARRESWLVEVLLALAEPAEEGSEAPRLQVQGREFHLHGAPAGIGPWTVDLARAEEATLRVELVPAPASGRRGGAFVGPLPPELERRPAGERWAMKLTHAGEGTPRATGWFWTPVPREFAPPAWRLPEELPLPHARPPAPSAPSPWAVPVLILGLGLLFASGLAREGQGQEASRRQRKGRSPSNRPFLS